MPEPPDHRSRCIVQASAEARGSSAYALVGWAVPAPPFLLIVPPDARDLLGNEWFHVLLVEASVWELVRGVYKSWCIYAKALPGKAKIIGEVFKLSPAV